MDTTRGPITFILHLAPDDGGGLRGVVQRVLTREKSRFEGFEQLLEILREGLRREGRTESKTGPDGAGSEQHGEERPP